MGEEVKQVVRLCCFGQQDPLLSLKFPHNISGFRHYYFDITFNFKEEHSILDRRGRVIQTDYHNSPQPPVVAKINLNPYQFRHHIHTIISQTFIFNMGIHPHQFKHYSLIERIVRSAHRTANEEHMKGLNQIEFYVDIDLVKLVQTKTSSIQQQAAAIHHQEEDQQQIEEQAAAAIHQQEDQQQVEQAIQESMGVVQKMVPASRDTIDALKKVKFEEEKEETNCIVCLEEIERDSEVIYLPCSHVYHGNCIVPWLEESHFCPICRFEMPTSKSD